MFKNTIKTCVLRGFLSCDNRLVFGKLTLMYQITLESSWGNMYTINGTFFTKVARKGLIDFLFNNGG